jgi:AraC family carnitine catabolism transcriptional activator
VTTLQSAKPYEVTILLLEQFAMIAFSSTVEPLREANWIAGSRTFAWKVVSHDGRAVRASNGLTVSVDGSIADASFCPMVIVCSSFDPHLYTTPATLAWLRKFARWGAHIGGVETATIHWENSESFAAEFPKVQLTGRIYEIDRRRFSASGAAAAMDMMLYFITLKLGRRVASAVAEEFIYNRMREGQIPQRLEASERMNTRQPRLRRLLRMLDSHLNDRLDVGKMAASEGISEREVRRLFHRYLEASPQAYHRALRLQKARLMLRQSDMPVSDVAHHCGFASGSDFSRAFKREFGSTPLDDRSAIYVLDRSPS